MTLLREGTGHLFLCQEKRKKERNWNRQLRKKSSVSLPRAQVSIHHGFRGGRKGKGREGGGSRGKASIVACSSRIKGKARRGEMAREKGKERKQRGLAMALNKRPSREGRKKKKKGGGCPEERRIMLKKGKGEGSKKRKNPTSPFDRRVEGKKRKNEASQQLFVDEEKKEEKGKENT